MASTFSPRNRGDREFQKFGLNGTAGDDNPIGLSVGGYTSTNIFKNIKVGNDGTLQTSASVTVSDITGSVKARIHDGDGNYATITGGKLDVNATLTSTALSSVVDSVKIVDGGGSITIDGTVTALQTALSSLVDSVKIVDGNGSITVDGTFWQTTQPVSATEFDIRKLNSAQDSVRIADGGGSITVDGTFWQGTQPVSGTFWQATQPVSATEFGVRYFSSITDSIKVSASLLDIRGLSNVIDSIRVSGDVAHDSADAGNPIKIGGKAYNFDGTVPGTAVAENDRANFITDIYGRQFVETGHPNLWSANASYTSAQDVVQLKASPGAGLNLYLTDVMMSCGAVGTIKLQSGNGGGAAVDLVPNVSLATNGGYVMNLRTPLRLAANSSISVTSTGGGTHSVLISGYTAA